MNARDEVLEVLELRRLGRHEAEDDVLGGWEEAEGREGPGARRVEFEVEGRVGERREQRVCDGFVGAARVVR